jgi:hypothetical protein
LKSNVIIAALAAIALSPIPASAWTLSGAFHSVFGTPIAAIDMQGPIHRAGVPLSYATIGLNRMPTTTQTAVRAAKRAGIPYQIVRSPDGSRVSSVIIRGKYYPGTAWSSMPTSYQSTGQNPDGSYYNTAPGGLCSNSSSNC